MSDDDVERFCRPLAVGDPVVHREKPFWNLGIVQSISDETGIVTCGWWADQDYFQAGCRPKKLRHGALAFEEARTLLASKDREIAGLREALEVARPIVCENAMLDGLPDEIAALDKIDQALALTKDASHAKG